MRRSGRTRSARRTAAGEPSPWPALVEELGLRPGPDVVDERVERRGAVALPLAPLVDQEPPQEVRPDERRVGVEDVLPGCRR